MTSLQGEDEGWQPATPAAADGLSVSSLHVRKGLPLALELGVTLGYAHELQSFDVGFDLKWSPLEGVTDLFQVGVRGYAATLVAQRDLNLIHGGVDLAIAKRFVVAGVVRLSVAAGYTLNWAHAVPETIVGFEPSSFLPQPVVFQSETPVLHRGLLGIHVHWGWLAAGLEASLGHAHTVSVSLSVTM